jgi:RNA polymerase sigma-70 factor (ECF subfamily)
MIRRHCSRSDSWLIKAYLGGDVGSFEELYVRYETRLLGYIAGMVGERAVAEDIFQETFLKVLRSLNRYREKGSFRAWLFKVAANLCRDHHRRRVRRERVERELARGGAVSPDPEKLLEEEQLRETLSRLVVALPEDQKEVVLLRTRGGLSFREIARLQGCPIGTALWRMHLAVRRLREGFGVE